MSIPALDWSYSAIVDALEYPAPERSVLNTLAKYHNPTFELSWPSVATIARKTGFKVRRVQMALRRLTADRTIADSGLRTPRGEVKWRLAISAQPPAPASFAQSTACAPPPHDMLDRDALCASKFTTVESLTEPDAVREVALETVDTTAPLYSPIVMARPAPAPQPPANAPWQVTDAQVDRLICLYPAPLFSPRGKVREALEAAVGSTRGSLDPILAGLKRHQGLWRRPPSAASAGGWSAGCGRVAGRRGRRRPRHGAPGRAGPARTYRFNGPDQQPTADPGQHAAAIRCGEND